MRKTFEHIVEKGKITDEKQVYEHYIYYLL